VVSGKLVGICALLLVLSALVFDPVWGIRVDVPEQHNGDSEGHDLNATIDLLCAARIASTY
jgi:hypothetical protein